MNIQEKDIVLTLLDHPFTNQRDLASQSGHSLGIVNRSLKNLKEEGYVTESYFLTEKSHKKLKMTAPDSAVILAAGYGMRIPSMNEEIPKGLLTINGEVLIERLIRQLQEKGIRKIVVIAGFMKESYEYLIDDFGVELIVCAEYAKKNNLHSLKCVLSELSNSYILPCDIYCAQNPFSDHELYSWYMVSDESDEYSSVRVNRKMELVASDELSDGNAMIGISYLTEEDAELVRRRIMELSMDKRYDGSYWEEALYNKDKMIIPAKVVSASDVIEINTYEQYCDAVGTSRQKKEKALKEAADYFDVSAEELEELTMIKKGITNHTYSFVLRGEKYTLRVPQEDNMLLLDRKREAEIYKIIKNETIGDDVVYINEKSGVKISHFIEHARPCNAGDPDDVRLCMQSLREFHDRALRTEYSMDLFAQIDKYEEEWQKASSAYKDYEKTKAEVYSLKEYIDEHAAMPCLSHLDLSEDNFMIVEKNDCKKVVLIDWEYAAMHDPYVDLAMFAVRSYYRKDQIDEMMDVYFPEGCTNDTRKLIYCYIAVCGLMWSNWCEYKRNQGVDFGEYSLKQYRYAKEYSRLVKNMS